MDFQLYYITQHIYVIAVIVSKSTLNHSFLQNPIDSASLTARNETFLKL